MRRKKGEPFVPAEKLIHITEGLKQGDEETQALFFQTFRGYIRKYIKTKVGHNEDIDELVNDTGHAVFNSIHSLNEPLALVTLVQKAAHSQIYHFYHDKEVEKKRKEKADRRAKETARREKLRQIRRCSGIDISNPRILDAVNALPYEQKEAVLLRSKGHKVREVALIQGVSEGTVKSRLNYARKKVLGFSDSSTGQKTNP